MTDLTPAVIVELYLNTCSLTFGTAPCTASDGGDPARRCFNTYGTCQDRNNYATASKLYRFSNLRLREPHAVGTPPAIPTIQSISFDSTILTPREGLGVRGSGSINLQDHVYNDSGVDPYLTARGVDWSTRSTFWRRLIARNQYWEGRPVRIITGLADEHGVMVPETIRTRSFILWSIDGPDNQGNVVLGVKDPLKLADADRSVWPKKSRAYLKANITDLATTFLVNDKDAAIAANFAAGQEYITCDDEIMKLTAVIPAVALDEFLLTVVRASIPGFYPAPQLNIADEHRGLANVQPCHLFEDAAPEDILYTLLTDGSDIDPMFLPLAEWTAEMASAGMQDYRMSALIANPEPIRDLIGEISEHDINIWWNERRAVVQVRPIQAYPIVAANWDERKNILADSVSIEQDVRVRISQAWVYFGLRWPLADRDKLESYTTVEVAIDQDTESANAFGRAAFQDTFSRWLQNNQGADASSTAARSVIRYRYGRARVTFSVDIKDDAPWTGDTVQLASMQAVTANGDIQLLVATIVEATEAVTEAGFVVSYVADAIIGPQGLSIRAPYWAPASVDVQLTYEGTPITYGGDPVLYALGYVPDYTDAPDSVRATLGYIAPDSGVFASDNSPAYTFAG